MDLQSKRVALVPLPRAIYERWETQGHSDRPDQIELELRLPRTIRVESIFRSFDGEVMIKLRGDGLPEECVTQVLGQIKHLQLEDVDRLPATNPA